jgi:hypothetical protein
MHPGDHSGHVIDLGIDLSTGQLSTQIPLISDEINEQQINKIQAINEQNHQSYQQVFLKKINTLS